jgi:hypothetical protein
LNFPRYRRNRGHAGTDQDNPIDPLGIRDGDPSRDETSKRVSHDGALDRNGVEKRHDIIRELLDP